MQNLIHATLASPNEDGDVYPAADACVSRGHGEASRSPSCSMMLASKPCVP